MLTKPLPGVQLNPIHPLSKGLVGYWLFNEGSGDIANDISGKKNHGTLKNMLPNTQGSKWQGSKFGGALDFDGQNDYVDCGDVEDVEGITELTIEGWIYLNAKNVYQRLVSKFNISENQRSIIFQILNTNKLYFSISNDGFTSPGATANTALDTGQWYYVSVVCNSGNVTFYLNGVSDGTGTTDNSIYNSTANLRIGADDYSNDYYFNGSIGGVKIYNRALSAEEGKQLYHDPFCNLIQVPAWQLYSPAVGGLSIPVAMHHYEALRV